LQPLALTLRFARFEARRLRAIALMTLNLDQAEENQRIKKQPGAA
jgi:hypothetical protein